MKILTSFPFFRTSVSLIVGKAPTSANCSSTSGEFRASASHTATSEGNAGKTGFCFCSAEYAPKETANNTTANKDFITFITLSFLGWQNNKNRQVPIDFR